MRAMHAGTVASVRHQAGDVVEARRRRPDAVEVAAEPDVVDAGIPERAYTVTLDDQDRLRWTTQVDGQEVTFTKEPETTWWQRFKVGLYRMLPIRGQL